MKGARPSPLPLTLPTETTEPRHSGSTGEREEGLSAEAGKGAGLSQGTAAGSHSDHRHPGV